MDEYFKRIQWSVNHVKQKGVASSMQPISSSCSVSSMSSMSSSVRGAGSSHSLAPPTAANNMARVSSMNSNLSSLSATTGFTYADIVAQIKQEKQELDNNLELYRRSSTTTHCSTTSSVTSTVSAVIASVAANGKKCHARKNKFKEVQHTANKVINEDHEIAESAESLKPKSKLVGLNKKDLYDFNPITNYFNYNKNLDDNMNDEFVRNSFEKYNLKYCQIKLVDCMKSDMFRDMQPPIQLTQKMQELLNLKADKKNLKAVKAKKANSSSRSRKKNQKSIKKSKKQVSNDVSNSTTINLTALEAKANEETMLTKDLLVANMETENEADNEAENEVDNEPHVEPVPDKADDANKATVSNKRKRSISPPQVALLNESLNNSCVRNAEISVTSLNVSHSKEEDKLASKKTPKLKNSIASFFESICKTFESTPNTSKFFSQPAEQQAEKENNSSCFETDNNNRPSKKLKSKTWFLLLNLC